MTKHMTAKFPGTCARCGQTFPAGTSIAWSSETRKAAHSLCPDPQATEYPVQSARGGFTYAQGNRVEFAERVEAPKAIEADLTKLVDFLLAARERGLKAPRLRVLSIDQRSELRLSLSKPSSRIPNSVYAVINEQYVGSVRPDGVVTGELQRQPLLLAYIAKVAEEPVAAAKTYGALTGRCMFCGLQLTDDGSVEVGYGPICAKRFGLPWAGTGTRNVEVGPKVGRFDIIEEQNSPAAPVLSGSAASRFDVMDAEFAAAERRQEEAGFISDPDFQASPSVSARFGQ